MDNWKSLGNIIDNVLEEFIMGEVIKGAFTNNGESNYLIHELTVADILEEYRQENDIFSTDWYEIMANVAVAHLGLFYSKLIPLSQKKFLRDVKERVKGAGEFYERVE